LLDLPLAATRASADRYPRAMSPLQRIAMGLVIVLLPANFPAQPSPDWAFYDALPDPIGWALVVAGVWALGRSSDLDLALVKWLAVVALAVSVPLWFPQVNHLLVPAHNPDIDVSLQWFLALPQTLFSLVLAREIGQAGRAADDSHLATRFGLLCWGFVALAVLPVVVYGGGLDELEMPMLVLIAVVNIAFIYQLFAVHRRPLLGGVGPRDWTATRERSRKTDEPPSR
jgi:hypothetical protein